MQNSKQPKNNTTPDNGDKSKGPDPKGIAASMMAAEKADYQSKIIIIPEIQDLLPALSPKAFEELQTSIKNEGIRDPLIIWKEQMAIVDGHNRYTIARMDDVPFETVEKSFPDLPAVKRWVIQNQLARRNLTKDEVQYFLGKLYEEVKQETGLKEPMGGKTAEDTIGEAYGVSGRTVRRAAEVAKGIDKVAQVKGRLAKVDILSGKGDYTKDELKEVGKTSNAAVASRAIQKIDAAKKAREATKKANVQTTKALAAAPTLYKVALCQPDFGHNSFNVTHEPKPPLDKEAMVYFIVPDEYIMSGIDLIRKWNLQYEGTIIYAGTDSYPGVYTKITHTCLMIATKGTVPGPKKGKEPSSVQTVSGSPREAIFKMIDDHAPTGARIDMRVKAKGKSPDGWDIPKK